MSSENTPPHPGQKKSQVRIQRRQQGNEVSLLCVRDGGEPKDRALREKQQPRGERDLEALNTRVETGHLKQAEKIHETIGRLKERYPRVARCLPDRV
jgi:hypothetical protein